MFKFLFSPRKSIVLIFILFICGFSILGYASSNLSQPPKGGEGADVVSGFSVNISEYHLVDDDPTQLKMIRLEIISSIGGESAQTVMISLDDGVEWISCNNQTGSLWDCPFPIGHEPMIATIGSLRVVAVGN